MLKNNKEFFDEELSGKDKTVKKLLVEYWEEIKDKNVISELDYEEFSNLLLRPKFIKDFNFKDRLEYINIGFMI